jgi:ubiquinone/menaquinone biosynthesis C-methylase UbiE
MGIISKLANQAREPTGRLGRFTLWTFNAHHSKLTDWGLTHVTIEKHHTILDVGCGGGLTVRKLAGMATAGKVYGIDVSEESVAASSRTNKQWIAMGRVEIWRGAVSHLPFSDDRFDLVTAVETHHFWPDLVADLHEVLRVLKPGGRLLIIAEGYKDGKVDERFRKLVELLQIAPWSVYELRDLFSTAGFSDVQMVEERNKGWICGIGNKPA